MLTTGTGLWETRLQPRLKKAFLVRTPIP
jgi:hypothetical protein